MAVHSKLLYAQEPNKYDFNTKVLSVEIKEPTKKDPVCAYLVELAETYFFITGGGQPGDKGLLIIQSGEEEVTLDVRSVDEINGRVIHECVYRSSDSSCKKPIIEVGSVVRAVVNKDLRKRRSQQHTGQHIISRVAEYLYGNAKTSSFTITDDVCSIELSHELAANEITRLAAETNKVIEAGLSVHSFIIDDSNSNDQESIELLNALKSQIMETDCFNSVDEVKLPSYPIRIVAIEGSAGICKDNRKWWDIGLCCGTHVKNIKEVAGLHIFSFNIASRGNIRNTKIVFSCGFQCFESLSANSTILKQTSITLSCGENMVLSCVEKLQNELKSLKKREKEFAALAFKVAASQNQVLSTVVDLPELRVDVIDTAATSLFDAITFSQADINGIAMETPLAQILVAGDSKRNKQQPKAQKQLPEDSEQRAILNIVCGVVGKMNQSDAKFICMINSNNKEFAEKSSKKIAESVFESAKVAGKGERLSLFLGHDENKKICEKKSTYSEVINRIKNTLSQAFNKN